MLEARASRLTAGTVENRRGKGLPLTLFSPRALAEVGISIKVKYSVTWKRENLVEGSPAGVMGTWLRIRSRTRLRAWKALTIEQDTETKRKRPEEAGGTGVGVEDNSS